jgi:hypothetical protein
VTVRVLELNLNVNSGSKEKNIKKVEHERMISKACLRIPIWNVILESFPRR